MEDSIHYRAYVEEQLDGVEDSVAEPMLVEEMGSRSQELDDGDEDIETMSNSQLVYGFDRILQLRILRLWDPKYDQTGEEEGQMENGVASH